MIKARSSINARIQIHDNIYGRDKNFCSDEDNHCMPLVSRPISKVHLGMRGLGHTNPFQLLSMAVTQLVFQHGQQIGYDI
jgi:hypothetical protein